jgi:signal transduction histidine kinase
VEVDLLLREAALRGMLLGQGDVVVEAPAGLSAVADPDRLLQVVSNLIGNAMRHGGAGVLVTLTASPVPSGGVVIDVADTGPGIAAGDLPRVFDRFYRGTAARRGAPGGAGLGLAIVASLVEAMGGTVSVRSTPGEGTTFSILLPAVVSPDSGDPSGMSPDKKAPPAPEGAGGDPGQEGEPSGELMHPRVSGTPGG